MIEQYKQYLEVCQKEIDVFAQQALDLKNQLNTKEQTLQQLVVDYHRERYQRQEEIWHSRHLTRCTSCYDVPPQQTQSGKRMHTSLGRWGIIPLSDAHYVSISGSDWHHTHGPDYLDSYFWFHRLCSDCYMFDTNRISQRSPKYVIKDLSQAEVNQINMLLENIKYSWEINRVLWKICDHANDIQVYWHKLPIPEEAYEIGEKIKLEHSTHYHYQLLRTF